MYYVQVYETATSRPAHYMLSATNDREAREEAEHFRPALAIGSGFVDVLRNGPPATSRVGRMYRRAAGVEWVN